MPFILCFTLGSAFAIKMAPGFFLARHAHLLLIACQAVGFLVYLGCVVRAFARITPLVFGDAR